MKYAKNWLSLHNQFYKVVYRIGFWIIGLSSRMLLICVADQWLLLFMTLFKRLILLSKCCVCFSLICFIHKWRTEYFKTCLLAITLVVLIATKSLLEKPILPKMVIQFRLMLSIWAATGRLIISMKVNLLFQLFKYVNGSHFVIGFAWKEQYVTVWI